MERRSVVGANVGIERRWSIPAVALASRATGPSRIIRFSAGATGAARRGPLRQPAQRVVAARAAACRRTSGAAPRPCRSPCRRRWGSRDAQPLQARQRSSASPTAGSASPPDQGAVERLLQHPGAAAGGVLLVAGREVRRAHHAARSTGATHLPTPVQRCTASPSEPPSWASRRAGRTRQPRADRAQVGVERRRVDEHAGVEQVVGVADRLDRGEQPRATRRRTSAAAAPTGPGRRRARRTASRRARAARPRRGQEVAEHRRPRRRLGSKGKSIRTCTQPSPKWP